VRKSRSRAAAIDDEDELEERRSWRSLLLRGLFRRPQDSIGLLVIAVAACAIMINALYLQPNRHPAPIFPVKPRPVVSADPTTVAVIPRPRPTEVAATKNDAPPARSRTEIVTDIQRELERRALYDGPIDGSMGPKTDAALRDFEQGAGLRPTGEPSEDVLRTIQRSPVKQTVATRTVPAANRGDPIGELIAPSPKRVLVVQRALADYGYGQVKPTGVFNPETRAAVERFERERKLPITGQVSDRLVRELAAVTGRPLE
jgi:peptidoglycan hydrolase-like protein with peptidoglycan-binding domain